MMNNTFNARDHHNRENNHDPRGYYAIRDITESTTAFPKDRRTSVGRVISEREMRYRRVYGHKVVDQMIESGTFK